MSTEHQPSSVEADYITKIVQLREANKTLERKLGWISLDENPTGWCDVIDEMEVNGLKISQLTRRKNLSIPFPKNQYQTTGDESV